MKGTIRLYEPGMAVGSRTVEGAQVEVAEIGEYTVLSARDDKDRLIGSNRVPTGRVIDITITGDAAE